MEITLKNLQKKIPIPLAKILKAAKAASRKLEKRGHSLPLSLSVVFVGAGRMRTINKKFLGHDYVTDVLTFDLGKDAGEIIICPQAALINAQAHQTSMRKELVLYLVHGLLHLAGYDDHAPKDIRRMRRMEEMLI